MDFKFKHALQKRNTTKYIIYLLLFSILIFSCSKDKEVAPEEVKCSVSKFDDRSYFYNQKGELIKIDHPGYTVELIYVGNKINLTETLKFPSGSKTTVIITLDDKGRVNKYVDNYYILEAKYNAEGYLIEVKRTDPKTGNYMATSALTYQNGNLIKINVTAHDGSFQQRTLSYTNILNKDNNGWCANYPLAELAYLQYPELVYLWGKGSKNLLREINSTFSDVTLNERDIWSYVLNEKGNITEATHQFSSIPFSYNSTFNISYQCN